MAIRVHAQKSARQSIFGSESGGMNFHRLQSPSICLFHIITFFDF
jgi:hypothetical protein